MEGRGKSKEQLIQEIEELRHRIQVLERTELEYLQTKTRLTSVINGMVIASPEPLQNIKLVTALCGQLLHGVCALYNRFENGMLCAVAQWNAPSDFEPVDTPQGHICFDVIEQGQDEPIVIRDLLQSRYADTDPNVKKYQLQTYVGQAVKFEGIYKGSLCVLYGKDHVPSDDDLILIRALARVLGVEEDRQSAGQALLESEKKYRTLFEDSRDGVYIVRRDGSILDVNSSSLEIFGYTKEEALQGNVQQLYVDPAARLKFQEEIEAKGFVKDYEIKLRKKDGTEIDCLQTSTLLVDEKGDVLGYQGFVRDVSEQKSIEELLRRSEALFRVILENMGSGVLAVDSLGRLILANNYARSFFGLNDYSVGLDLPHILPGTQVLFGKEQKGIREAVIDLPEGKRKIIQFSRVIPSGEHFSIILFNDVTLLVENEERIRRAEQLAVAGEATARLSHEIKNPLTTILIGLGTLEKGRSLGSEDRNVIAMVMNEVRSLSSIIKHLLDATRPSPLTLSLMRIELLVRECFEVHRMTARAEGLELDIIGGPPETRVLVDSRAMRRVLTNLVQNSLDACQKGDRISLGWRVLSEDETAIIAPGFAGQIAAIFVEDSGRGIPEDVSVTSLFKPFFTIKESGTGLGLTVSLDIAERHGGTIIAHRRTGSSTRFEILLPLGERPPCWEINCREFPESMPDQPACSTCEIRMSGSGHLCWEIKGRGVKAETGRWAPQCLECPVFRGGNLSVFVGPEMMILENER